MKAVVCEMCGSQELVKEDGECMFVKAVEQSIQLKKQRN